MTRQKTLARKQQTKNFALDYFSQTQPHDRDLLGKNYLIDLLLRLYDKAALRRVLDDYCVGFQSFVSREVEDSLIFWYINEGMLPINAKKMQYKFYNPQISRIVNFCLSLRQNQLDSSINNK